MISEQNIREITFDSARIGGYSKTAVDDFLDQVADAVAAQTRENAALKEKMRVLVKKIDEYRQTEDSMRLALLSAQKMSAEIEAEARKKADAVVAEAQQQADAVLGGVREEAQNEELKLAEAKKATQKFVDYMRAACTKQMEFYDRLSGARLVSQAAPETAPAAAPAPAPAAAPAKPAAPAPQKRRASAEPAAEDDEEEATRMFASEPKKKKRAYEEFRFGDED